MEKEIDTFLGGSGVGRAASGGFHLKTKKLKIHASSVVCWGALPIGIQHAWDVVCLGNPPNRLKTCLERSLLGKTT